MKFRLCIMMFLQFFIWGAWFEIGFSYIPALKFAESWMTPLIFTAFNVGAIVALFFSTQFADRKFAAERFLSFSHLVGGLAILGLFFLQTKVGTGVGEVASVRIEGQHESSLTDGIGEMPDKTKVVVKKIVSKSKDDEDEVLKKPETQAKLAAYVAATPGERVEKKLGEGLGDASKFWAVFNEELTAYKKATEEERKEKKLNDPRFVKTFVISEKQAGTMTGDASTPLAPFWPFFILMAVHAVFYVPTISITNAIAFNAFTDPDKEFGPVRLWGTIGWIAASWPFIFILVDWAAMNQVQTTGFVNWLGTALAKSLSGAAELDGQRYIFLVAGVASLLLSAFSWLLPHTPPKPASGEDSLAWLKAAKLLAKPFVLVLFVVTFIDAAVHQSFFVWTPDYLKSDRVGIGANWVPAVMKIGQLAEIVTMLVLGYVLKTFGWRITMIVGVLGHAGRFAVFAYVPDQTAVILINVLHGVCYAFFFATVYIFVDAYFPKDIRSSAQGLFNLLILGIGPIAANFACAELRTRNTTGVTLNYPAVFQFSMYAGFIGALLLLFFFHPPKKTEESAS
jgi:MFS family permease